MTHLLYGNLDANSDAQELKLHGLKTTQNYFTTLRSLLEDVFRKKRSDRK